MFRGQFFLYGWYTARTFATQPSGLCHLESPIASAMDETSPFAWPKAHGSKHYIPNENLNKIIHCDERTTSHDSRHVRTVASNIHTVVVA